MCTASERLMNLAVPNLPYAAIALYDNAPPVEGLAADRAFQRRPEGIRSQYADDEGRGGILETLRRPFHELREVEKEDRLHLILGRGFNCRTSEV
jgi:hypothetical protein